MKYSWFLLFLIFSSCISLTEKIGRFLDGSNERIIEHYRGEQDIDILKVVNRNKEEAILIILNKFPMIRIRASCPDEEGNIHLISLEYLGGSSQGWNEYSLALLGEGTFIAKELASFSIIKKIESVQITSGRIQRRDTRIAGDEAITALRNRHERLLALVEWMLSQDAPKTFEKINDFSNYWEPILLPEQVSRKKRPANWRQEGDTFQRAESIRWNTGYTARVFPEELRPIRDSGTLLRDWEETIQWIYMEYEWENIVKLLSSQLTLQKIK